MMRRTHLVTAALSLFGLIVATPAAAQLFGSSKGKPALNSALLSDGLRIEKIWSEGRKGHATLRFRNLTGRDLDLVTLDCAAFDSNEKAIGSGQTRLSSVKVDANVKTELVVSLIADGLESMSCSVAAKTSR